MFCLLCAIHLLRKTHEFSRIFALPGRMARSFLNPCVVGARPGPAERWLAECAPQWDQSHLSSRLILRAGCGLSQWPPPRQQGMRPRKSVSPPGNSAAPPAHSPGLEPLCVSLFLGKA